MTTPVSRTAVLHIGPMKTGSTSIQSWLRHNQDALRGAGVATPFGKSLANLSKLAAIFQDKRRGQATTGVTLKGLTTALAGLTPDITCCVLSGELMAQQMSAKGIASLRETLEPYFGDWRVVLYLRRQDEIETSRLTTVLKRGSERKTFDQPVDYERVIADWSGVFGREAIRPRLFARDALVGGDVVLDFAEAAGLPALPAATAPKTQNTSLKPEAQIVLRKLADQAKSGAGKIARLPGYAALIETLNADFAGRGVLPARAQAEAFVAQVAGSNERVRAEWFPDRATLFSDDFSVYPEQPAPPPTEEAQLKVALAIVLHLLGSPPPRKGGKRRGGKRRKQAKA